MEVRDLLSEYDFDGDNTPIIVGSALKCLEEGGEWEDPIVELMEAVDEYVPTPVRATDEPFLMPVEDVLTITGRGTVATGRVERGVLKVGDTVEIVGLVDKPRDVVVTGVEMFHKQLIRQKPVIISVLCCVVFSAMKSSVDRFWLPRTRFIRTPSLKVRSMC